MKKILAITLALVLGLTSLTACGQKKENNTSQETKVLKVGMECTYAPYNWSQKTSENGAVKINDSSDYAYGYDVMMAKYLAEKIGYEVQIVKLDWDSLPMAVQSGAIDCAIAGQSITKERMESVDFTGPYYYASIVTLAMKDSKYATAKSIKDLDGAKATSQINTVWYKTCLPQIPNVKKLTAMENVPQMLVALTSGATDLIITDQPTAMAAVSSNSNIIMMDFTNSEDNYKVSEEEINIGISLKKGNTELADLLNGALKNLNKSDFEKMMNDAIKVQPLAN